MTEPSTPTARVGLIVGSVRPNSRGPAIARWFCEQVAPPHANIEVIELATTNLPLFNERANPKTAAPEGQMAQAWSRQISALSAVIMLTPEYNHAYPASLKNAIDYLHTEWRRMPVGFISYGGISGGTRAVGQLKPVVAALGMQMATSSVIIPHVDSLFDPATGQFCGSTQMASAGQGMLSELLDFSQKR